jgi:hypothetical protein
MHWGRQAWESAQHKKHGKESIARHSAGARVLTVLTEQGGNKRMQLGHKTNQERWSAQRYWLSAP